MGGWVGNAIMPYWDQENKEYEFPSLLEKRNVNYHMENSGVMGMWVTRFDI
jgi:hypothetical protein